MPQPYRGDGAVFFAKEQMLADPKLSAHIATIALLWTFTEETWAYLFGVMLKFEASAGLTIYHALTGTGSQRAILNEVADEYLPQHLRADFAAAMKISKQRALERNAVVHGMWFHDPKIPDALILAPRNVFSMLTRKVVGRAMDAVHSGRPIPTDPIANYNGWFVYKERDFKAIEGRIMAFFHQQDALLDALHAHVGAPPNQALKLPLQSGS